MSNQPTPQNAPSREQPSKQPRQEIDQPNDPHRSGQREGMPRSQVGGRTNDRTERTRSPDPQKPAKR
jgi:hypothetical protein